jgi:RNA polymerase sigma-70 factor (ECF subfamily)
LTSLSEDALLVDALRKGEEAAFVALLDRFQPALIRLAADYVHDRAIAEDVVQETWVAVLRGLDGFQGRASLKTWLFQIVINRARTRAAREDRSVSFSTLADLESHTLEPAVEAGRFLPPDHPNWPGHWLVAPSEDDLPEQRLLADELLQQVRACVASLPPAQREVVRLRDIDGCTSDEVCQLLGLSEANQRVLLHRGRSRVRAALEQYLERKHLQSGLN